MGRIETCIFCHKSSEFIGRLEDANDDDSYCPFCGATQVEAAQRAELGVELVDILNQSEQYEEVISNLTRTPEEEMDEYEGEWSNPKWHKVKEEIENKILAAFKV